MNTPIAKALDAGRIRAITIDLDDTLWPIWPIIARAEAALAAWMAEHAPATAAQWADPVKLRAVRAPARAHRHITHGQACPSVTG